MKLDTESPIAPPMPQQRFLDLLRQRVSKPRQPAPAAETDEPGDADAVAAGSFGRVA